MKVEWLPDTSHISIKEIAPDIDEYIEFYNWERNTNVTVLVSGESSLIGHLHVYHMASVHQDYSEYMYY